MLLLSAGRSASLHPCHTLLPAVGCFWGLALVPESCLGVMHQLKGNHANQSNPYVE